MASDHIILGEGENCIFSTDPSITGITNNLCVVGGTGSGKTMSILEPRLLEAYHSNLLVTVTKRRVVEKYTPLLQKRGYEVLDLNFSHPEKGNIGYDPLTYICSYQDITELATAIVLANPRKERTTADPYWDDTGISLLSSEISYLMMTRDGVTFADVLEFHSKLDFEESDGRIVTNYDEQFARLEKRAPSCFAVNCWKTFVNLPIRSAGCVYSSLNTTLDSTFTPEIRKLFQKKSVDMDAFASKKTILFLTTSPVNRSHHYVTNLFYTQAFGRLFEFAEFQPNGALPIPVEVLAEDFATGCPISLFDEFISIFREKGVSFTILLQSESQLEALYGQQKATTILNNCDSYVYLGSNDLHTAQNVALRANRLLEDVLYLPVGDEILFRRGQKPIFTKRYNIQKDKQYQRVTREYGKNVAAQMRDAVAVL